MNIKQKTIEKALKIEGLVDIDELGILYDNTAVRVYDNCRFLETGAYFGRSTLVMATLLSKANGKLETVDLFDNKSGEARVEYKKHDVEALKNNLKGLLGCITIHKGDELEIIKNIKGRFDMVFLDGDHRSEVIEEELEILAQKTNYIMGHDYQLNDVRGAVNQFCQKRNILPKIYNTTNQLWEISL